MWWKIWRYAFGLEGGKVRGGQMMGEVYGVGQSIRIFQRAADVGKGDILG